MIRVTGNLSASVTATYTIAAPTGASVTAPNDYVRDAYGFEYTVDNWLAGIEVVNVTGTAAIYFTINGSEPSIAGQDCYCVPAGVGQSILVPVGQSKSRTVKLISSGTPTVHISGR